MTVKAKNENDAIDLAHQNFEVGYQKGIPEDYDERMVEVEEIE